MTDAARPTPDLKALVGRLGLLDGSFQRGRDAHAGEWAQALERDGVGCLWVPDASWDLGAVRSLADATRRVAIGTAIVNVWTCTATDLAVSVTGVADAAGERFVLGLGISHAPLVARLGHVYDRPVDRLGSYLDDLDRVAPGVARRCMLGVNGPRMLALAAERTAGALTYLVTPEHTAAARAIVGPDRMLAVEQMVLLETEPRRARALARERLAIYLTLPNYLRNLATLGFGEADVADGGSDRLIDGLVAWGDGDAIARRLREQWAAGADHVAVHLLGPRDADPAPAWHALAHAALGQ